MCKASRPALKMYPESIKSIYPWIACRLPRLSFCGDNIFFLKTPEEAPPPAKQPRGCLHDIVMIGSGYPSALKVLTSCRAQPPRCLSTG